MRWLKPQRDNAADRKMGNYVTVVFSVAWFVVVLVVLLKKIILAEIPLILRNE